MKTSLSEAQVLSYQKEGFLLIEDFLSADELSSWRTAVTEAIEQRGGRKLPYGDVKVGEDDGINKESDYYGKVFDQLLNLWQTNDKVKQIMLDEKLGKMVATLAGCSGIRIWHDQALIKRPWANPTSWHLDTPFWSFSDRRAMSIWVALDDATYENGCLYFIPGSCHKTTFENPGIGKNMDAIFDFYPQFKNSRSVAVPMKAGSCSFHNGLTIHGAGANMTNGFRRAMTCAYMPDGATFNGIKNILTDEQVAKLKVGDLLNDNAQNPLIYSK
ncbi:phytanoyl-CoA dioxygenase family protein [Flavitalea sp. BT771]|uniref:phytanoyl-CoA dioxygenase family protein n=1 Tax=Flavitalea sp. BT771 TaxID=3063329 RepID=UPI0026E3B8FC|nr:phytanoyl-CoA dioxygenase family protein [Flavitalea sp. BT771]MDO6432227.1 phytanoyl-CoA dioxygenase family protein [Flavitalea sp. BT771]MDV6221137.1 phytanoyl-CoA dioxygenase family protein [Flavitalea sp. BT771]